MEVNHVKNIFKKKPVIVGIVLIIIIGGYFIYKTSNKTAVAVQYVTGTVQKGTISVSITGSGQISGLSQIDLKSKVSGDIIYIGKTTGQEFKTGDILLQIDSGDAYRTVRDAQTSYEIAKLSLDKLFAPADELSVIQSENSLKQAEESKQTAENNLTKDYDSGVNSVTSAFLDLPNIMTGLYNILFVSGTGTMSQWSVDFYTDSVKGIDEKANEYRTNTIDAYNSAKVAYDKNFTNYKVTSRLSDTGVVEDLINETYDTVLLISDAVKNSNNLIQFYQDKMTFAGGQPIVLANTQLTTLSGYTSKVNSHSQALLSTKNSILSDKNSIISAVRTINEKTISYAELKSAPDPIEVRNLELTVQQRKDALTSAQLEYANYYIRAPFDGVIGKSSVNKYDEVSSGTTIASLITKQKIAEITLNEVDVAKVKVGQKAVLTFDAIDGLTISGAVAEVDSIGTASQGVVSYGVKIIFDTQDARIKSGMSVSAVIITDVKTDVIMVPSSAVKSDDSGDYVQIFDSSNQVKDVSITTGLSDDLNTEVMSGLVEGDKIITQAMTATTSASPANAGSSSLRIPGITGGVPGR
jgi:HlyD family secretion protein